ncbi:MAG: O-antigen polysaccharide polymerase Wzy [Chloroflexi bacterium]|nr:MAG: O-antigen polysaccharide polymerase Wzy [Chloroflexota bacterium]
MTSKVIPYKQTKHFLWFSSISFGISFLLIGLWIWQTVTSRSDSIVFAALLALLLLCLGIALLIRLITRPNGDVFEIIVPLTGLFILHYPIRALFIMGWPHLARFPVNWPINSDRYILQGVLISLVGFISFYLGYFWQGKVRLHKFIPKIPFHDKPPHFLWGKIIIVFSIGIFAFSQLFNSGAAMRFVWNPDQVNSVDSQLWVLLSAFRDYALVLAWSSWGAGRKYKFLAVLFLGINIIIGIGIGSKNAIFVSLLAVLLSLNYALKVSRKRLFWLSAFGITVFIFLFFPFVQNYRQTYLDIVGFQTTRKISDLVEVADATSLSDTGNVAGGKYGQNNVVDVINRAVWFNAIVMIRWRVPSQIDYQIGSTFYPLLIGWIPRAIWPNKPILSQGAFMHNVIIGASTQSNVGLTSIGDFYLNFGLLGVLIGMFLLGVIIRTIYLYGQSFTKSIMYLSLFYFMLYPQLLFSLQSSVATGLLGVVRIVMLAAVIIAFLSLGGRAKHTNLSSYTQLRKSQEA